MARKIKRQDEPQQSKPFVLDEWIDYSQPIPEWVLSDMDSARKGLILRGTEPMTADEVLQEWREGEAWSRHMESEW